MESSVGYGSTFSFFIIDKITFKEKENEESKGSDSYKVESDNSLNVLKPN